MQRDQNNRRLQCSATASDLNPQIQKNNCVFCVSSCGIMLEGYSPVTQALLGTLFTWGLTAAGAALVFVFSSRQVEKDILTAYKQ